VNCKDFERLSALDLSGELSPKVSAQLRSHLASCDACRRFADGMRASREVLESWRAATSPEELMAEVRRSVLARVSEARPALSFRERLELIFRAPRAPLFGSMAAAAVIAVAIWLTRSQLPSSNTLARPEPVDIAAKPASVANSERAEGATGEQSEKLPIPADASAGTKLARPASPIFVRPSRTAAAKVAHNYSQRPAPILRRIELQTADPNIRIIWLIPREARRPLPEGPHGG
jgi:hypothetical protein